ncbi:MAG: hypothetical protein WCT05_11400 [Lentisphaeria bacterium]
MPIPPKSALVSPQKLPSLCVLLLRICRIPTICANWKCKLGFACLISNVPIGILGAATCILLHTITNKHFFLLLATITYATSWLILLLGIVLTGKHLSGKIRKKIKIKFQAWGKTRKKLRQNCATFR